MAGISTAQKVLEAILVVGDDLPSSKAVEMSRDLGFTGSETVELLSALGWLQLTPLQTQFKAGTLSFKEVRAKLHERWAAMAAPTCETCGDALVKNPWPAELETTKETPSKIAVAAAKLGEHVCVRCLLWELAFTKESAE